MGDWLPENRRLIGIYLEELLQKLYKTQNMDAIDNIEDERGEKLSPLLPPVKELKDKIGTDSKFNMYFTQMFTQIPKDLKKDMKVKNYHVLLRTINHLITMPPMYTDTHVGCPINGILTWPMGTVAGYAAFMDDEVNIYIGRILTAWRIFLQSEDSREHLNTEEPRGWFCPTAMTKQEDFVETYRCDPEKKYFGFDSWDDYFTRRLRKDARPVASPDDPNVICNACESAPYRLRRNVKAVDKFWLKSMPYSITFMLNNDPLAEQFVGGTVYQGFLSNMSYHRWHSPVDGTIVRAYNVGGGFYTECRAKGWDDEGDNRSQGYLTETQARALIFIQADNPYIGLMCFVSVGMGDVSSNEITVYEGQRVKKGDDTGTFHVGGSTHCLVFRPGVELDFDFCHQIPSINAHNIMVKELIATVPYCGNSHL